MSKMANNKALEERVHALEKSMSTVVKALKELNAGINEIQAQKKKDPVDEIEEIIENKKVIEENLARHTEAIKRIEEVIVKMEEKLKNQDNMETENPNEDQEAKRFKYKEGKCRYYDKGFCKYKSKCRYFHPNQICEEYGRTGNCQGHDCKERHPERCRQWSSGKCKRNNNCDFLHVTLADDDERSYLYQCVGCKNEWADRTCVVQHNINGKETFFCLNCQDWIQYKTRVHNHNWTLYDEAGNLRRDV